MSGLDKQEADFLQMMATVQSQEFVEWLRKNVFPAISIADRDFLGSLPGFEYLFDVTTLTQPFENPALFLSGKQDSLWGYADSWKICEFKWNRVQ